MRISVHMPGDSTTPPCAPYWQALSRRARPVPSESTYLAPFPRVRFHGRLKPRGDSARGSRPVCALQGHGAALKYAASPILAVHCTTACCDLPSASAQEPFVQMPRTRILWVNKDSSRHMYSFQQNDY